MEQDDQWRGDGNASIDCCVRRGRGGGGVGRGAVGMQMVVHAGKAGARWLARLGDDRLRQI